MLVYVETVIMNSCHAISFGHNSLPWWENIKIVEHKISRFISYHCYHHWLDVTLWLGNCLLQTEDNLPPPQPPTNWRTGLWPPLLYRPAARLPDHILNLCSFGEVSGLSDCWILNPWHIAFLQDQLEVIDERWRLRRGAVSFVFNTNQKCFPASLRQ